MNDIVPALGRSIFQPTYDIVSDAIEIGLDSLIESDVLREIPVVKSIVAVCKVGYNIRERNLIKQTLSFISGCNSGSISQEQIDAYRQELESDPTKAEKELGRVLIILGSHIEDRQSQVLGRFYNAYVKGAISWDKFCELSEANRRMFISDYYVLMDADKNDGLDIGQRELYQVDRLISLGLLQNGNRLGGSAWIEYDNPKPKDIKITSFGRTFCQNMPVVI